MNAPLPPPPAPKKRFPTWAIVLLALFGVFVFVVPVFAVLAVYGVRKYIANAKTAEARVTLATLAKDAAAAYERDHALCRSASSPVPVEASLISGQKYQSAAAEWEVDRAKHAGFACLGFSLELPQYFQYSYVAPNPGGFEVTAHGDLNGDGQYSTFVVRGQVQGGVVQIAPQIEETSPQE
jgi:type IV pilus assembly protein PilA